MAISKEQAKSEGWALTSGNLRIAYDERGGSRFRGLGELFSWFIEQSATSEDHKAIYLSQTWNFVDGMVAGQAGWNIQYPDTYHEKINELVDQGDVVALKALLLLSRRKLRQ